MTFEQQYLLSLMRVAIAGKRLDALPPGKQPDWTALAAEASAQTVDFMVFDAISQLKDRLPEDFYQKSFRLARQSAAANMRIEFAQAELVQVLNKLDCPYVILKGEVAASTYPVPEIRLLGDVDFLIPLDRTEQVTEAMQALGYQHSWEPGDYHQVLVKRGACLEMHMEVAGTPEGEAREPVLAYLSSLYEKSVLLDRGFGPFRAPCPEHHAMVLILHMQHHVVSWGMGLRHMADWACAVNKMANDSFWQESLLPLLKKIGLFHFTAVITKMCSLFLGSVCPDWAFYVEEDLCRDLMEDILSGGNFGRKDENRKRSINMLPDWEKDGKQPGKLKLLYLTLKNSVIHTHPELEKKSMLLHLKMLGKAIRYIWLYLRGKRPSLRKAALHADTRRDIYQRLRMFEK